MRFSLVAVVALELTSLVPAAAQQGARGRLTVERYLDWERVADPQVSPDGRRVVYTRGIVDKLNDRWRSELWLVETDGSRHRFLVEGESPRWSPDGTRIAYIAEGKPKGKQIFVRWMDAEGATSQITHLTEPPSDIEWSPDGTRIAFTAIVPEPETWDIPLPKPPEGAEWTRPPRIVRRLHYRQDRRGFLPEGFRHLFVVAADGGTPRRLTEGRWHVGARFSGLDRGAGLSWTPDGKSIVFDGLDDEDDRKYRESHIYVVDVATRERRRLTTTRGPWASPRVSPDGRFIAYTGYEWTAQTYRAADLYVMGIDGSEPRPLTRRLDRDPENPLWAADSSRIYFTVDDRGSSNLYAARTNGDVEPVTEGVHMLSVSSISRDGLAVGVRSAPHEPGDVVAFRLDAPAESTRLTRVNDDVLADVELGEVEEIWYESTGGARIQGWIVKPPGFDPAKDYPLILHIHGGPHAMYNVGFNFSFQNFAANDFVVLYTNPRGSTGYGTDFGNAIDNAYPSVDHEDLMAGVDAVLARGYVDPKRLYATGCSGGGVLSSWAIGHTDRFAAAAVRCPVTNWLSFAGTTDIVAWAYHRFEGNPWDNAEKYLEHSPLMYAGRVRTPTLLMTGELDLRTPMSQTEEYYAALKMRGVPTVMLRFHEEYHGTGSKPSNFMRTQLYIMDWFRRYPETAEGGPTQPQ